MADEVAENKVPKPSSTMDLATIIGLIAGFGLISSAIILGGDPLAFVNPPSILIVIGGTLAVTSMCFTLKEMAGSLGVISKTFFYSSFDASDAAMQVLELSEMARKKGVLSLQNMVDSLKEQPFLYKGMLMIVDGTPSEEVESILRLDRSATLERHKKGASILRKAAEFAPAMGLIGTLIGLVQMLGNLEDPSTIGPAMAVALLTTFYGAVLANMVFSPMAAKLERNSTAESTVTNVYLMGASSIGRQESPRRLEMLLNSILPPSKRIQYFD
jgi:chemotaxis protein MotA